MLDGSRGFVSLLTTLGIVAVLASHYGHAHPAFDTISAFRVQAIVVFAVVLVFAVAFVARTARVLALVGVAAAAMGLTSAILPGNPPVETHLTVLSHNLRFDNQDHDAVLQTVALHDPDVLVLQEVSAANRPLFDALAADYPARVLCPFLGVGGVAVMGKGAPVGQPGCAEGDGFAWLRQRVAGQVVTVGSLHLEWPWPYGQPRQLDRLDPALARIGGPTVLAGDFNAAAWSHAVDRIGAATGTRPTAGLRLTFRNPVFWPGLPLDHVLISDSLAAETEMLEANGSDHRALLTRIEIRY